MTRVKICGITSVTDAVACAAAGADAIGMLVDVKISPRSVTVEQAKMIVSSLPVFAVPVIVMMPSTADEVIDAARRVRPGAIQLHGNEPAEMLRLIKRQLPWVRLIKAVHIGSGGELERAKSYEGVADAVLLDTVSPAMGGTGKSHDWSLSGQIIRSIYTPVLLAGGLSPANVADAVRAARPYAVDVSSGVEIESKKKDMTMVREFISKAKGA